MYLLFTLGLRVYPGSPLSHSASCHPSFCLLTCSVTLQLPPSTGTFQEAQSRLNEAAAGLNQAATELVQASRGTPQDLARASGRFGQDFSTFLEAGVEMAGQAQVRRGEGSAHLISSNGQLGGTWVTKLLTCHSSFPTPQSHPSIQQWFSVWERRLPSGIGKRIVDFSPP